MSWDHPQPFTRALQPRAVDIDGLAHTNNTVYVQWCEQLAWAHSEALGLALCDYRRLDRAMVIRAAHYDYRLATVEGEALTLGTWLVAGNSRVTMTRLFQLRRDADGATAMRARWDLACIELSSGRPRPLPEAFLRVYLGAGGQPR